MRSMMRYLRRCILNIGYSRITFLRWRSGLLPACLRWRLGLLPACLRWRPDLLSAGLRWRSDLLPACLPLARFAGVNHLERPKDWREIDHMARSRSQYVPEIRGD